MDSICSPDLEIPPPPPSVWLDDFQHAADQTMENTGDTVPSSIPDLQTAPIKSYQSKLTTLLKTDSVDNFLESLTEYDLASITSSAGAAGASSWLTSPPDYNQPLSSEQFQSAVLL
jgi:hypothetical protein